MQPRTIPNINFSRLSAEIDIDHIDDQSISDVSKLIIEAFETTGFLFLLNSGITEEEVLNFNEVTRRFFKKPSDVKQKFSRNCLGGNHGWVALEKELLEPGTPSDMKESFNVSVIEAKSSSYWPNNEFKDVSMKLFEKLTKITQRLLLTLAVGLNLDKFYFFNKHNIGFSENTGTSMRSLFYPALTYNDMRNLKHGQQRCGLHTDYGSVTLLISDNFEGLQVKNRDESFIDVRSNDPASVLVNLGDLMQMWTNNRLLATEHRVLFPKMKEEFYKHQANSDDVVIPERRSTAFFVHPDADTIVSSLNGDSVIKSGVVASQYLQQRFDDTYL